MNEFYITSAKVKFDLFETTTTEGQDKSGALWVERLPGSKSLKMVLESSGPFDEMALKSIIADGKKVKILIVDE